MLLSVLALAPAASRLVVRRGLALAPSRLVHTTAPSLATPLPRDQLKKPLPGYVALWPAPLQTALAKHTPERTRRHRAAKSDPPSLANSVYQSALRTATPPPAPSARNITRGIRISPRKLNDMAYFVRGLSVREALAQLEWQPKKAARFVAKGIANARANAINTHNMDDDRLVVSEAFVSKHKVIQRIRYHGRGKTGAETRRFATLTVVLREQPWRPLERRVGRAGLTHATYERFRQRQEASQSATSSSS